MSHTYDVVIIGAGTAGLSARKEVAKLTDNYLLVDDGILGTTCARVGCMPSKVLIQIANDFNRRHSFAQEGIQGGENLSLDRAKAMAHVRSLRDRFVRGVLSGIEKWQGTHFKAKRAKFVDANTLDLGDEKITAKKIIIATGSRPIVPDSWKPFSQYFLDTNQFFEQEFLPEKIAVVGLGVIGIELGQALHRLGFDVTGIGRGPSIGGLTDPFIQSYVKEKFSQEMKLQFEGVESLREENNQLILSGPEGDVVADKVLLAMGRTPNVESLGLENLPIELDQRGVPLYDPTTFQIGDSPIFIAGDVNGQKAILHEASDEGHIVGYNAMQAKPQCFQPRTQLAITFCSPNIAIAGKSYQQLKNEGIEFEIGEVSFEGQGRSIVMLQEKGHLRIYGEKGSGKILGAEMLAPHGEHIAHLLAWSMSLGLNVHEAIRMPFYHPVVEEGLRTALRHLASNFVKSCEPLEVLRCDDAPVELEF